MERDKAPPLSPSRSSNNSLENKSLIPSPNSKRQEVIQSPGNKLIPASEDVARIQETKMMSIGDHSQAHSSMLLKREPHLAKESLLDSPLAPSANYEDEYKTCIVVEEPCSTS